MAAVKTTRPIDVHSPIEHQNLEILPLHEVLLNYIEANRFNTISMVSLTRRIYNTDHPLSEEVQILVVTYFGKAKIHNKCAMKLCAKGVAVIEIFRNWVE